MASDISLVGGLVAQSLRSSKANRPALVGKHRLALCSAARGPCLSTAASELLFSKNTIPTEPGQPWRPGKPEHPCCHLEEEKVSVSDMGLPGVT